MKIFEFVLNSVSSQISGLPGYRVLPSVVLHVVITWRIMSLDRNRLVLFPAKYKTESQFRLGKKKYFFVLKNDPAAHQNHCEKCRIWTQDCWLQWANTSSVSNLIQYLITISLFNKARLHKRPSVEKICQNYLENNIKKSFLCWLCVVQYKKC